MANENTPLYIVQNSAGDKFDIRDARLENCTETSDGVYVWQCTIVNGVKTYGWAKLVAYLGGDSDDSSNTQEGNE